MALIFKIDVLSELKNAGYTSYKIRQDKIFSQSTLQELRSGKIVKTTDNLERLCKLLNLQPGDLIEYVADPVQDAASDND